MESEETFGEFIKRERTLRGISLDEIAQATRIKREYLEAIENNSFQSLPNQAFVKGYIRAYSRYCGLNEDDVVVNYDFFQQHDTMDTQKGQSEYDGEHKAAFPLLRTLIYILIAIILSLTLAWFFRTSSLTPRETNSSGGSSAVTTPY